MSPSEPLRAALLALCACAPLLHAQQAQNLDLLFHWNDTTFTGLPTGTVRNRYNEIWGWHDPQRQREYAILCSAIGTHFFDVTNPTQTRYVDFVPGRTTGVVNRDAKTKGHYLYTTADQGLASLQIIDLSPLPDSVHLAYDSDSLWQRAHTLWIEGDRLYATSTKRYAPTLTQLGQLSLYDISNPLSPTLLHHYNDYGEGVHALYTRGDTAWVNAGFQGLYIRDLRDPAQPNTLARYSAYPFQGYNHTGWLNPQGTHYLFTDETHGTAAQLLHVQDLQNLATASYLYPQADSAPTWPTLNLPHNCYIRGNYAYLAHYYDGVQIFDLQNPHAPKRVAHYDTYPGPTLKSFDGCWGLYPFLPSGTLLASDMQHGLFVLAFKPLDQDLQTPLNTRLYATPHPQHLQLAVTQGLLPPATAQLFDPTGRTLLQAPLQGQAISETLPLPAPLSAGIYTLRFTPQDPAQPPAVLRLWVP